MGRRGSRSIRLLAAGMVTLLATACAGANLEGSTSPSASSEGTAVGPDTGIDTTTSTSTSTTSTTVAWPRTPQPPLPVTLSAPVLSTVATADPVVFLTIDDGLVRDPRVPELIERFRIPATLFLNEGPLREDPDYFRRVAAFGSINSHTRSHPSLLSRSEASQRAEICGMRSVISEYVLFPGHFFRAPYGLHNAATQRAAASCGINAVLFWHAAADEGVLRYQHGHELHPGDIVLAHFRPQLYDDITALWWQAASQGLTLASLDDYLPLPSSP